MGVGNAAAQTPETIEQNNEDGYGTSGCWCRKRWCCRVGGAVAWNGEAPVGIGNAAAQTPETIEHNNGDGYGTSGCWCRGRWCCRVGGAGA